MQLSNASAFHSNMAASRVCCDDTILPYVSVNYSLKTQNTMSKHKFRVFHINCM